MTSLVVSDNITCLQQGADLLESMDDELYTRQCDSALSSAIGGHIRHNIEHYQSLLDGCGQGRIDYDARERNPLIETSSSMAVKEMKEIISRLEDLEDVSAGLTVKMDTGSVDAGAKDCWSGSTVLRELQFLLSHSIHHYALIATICHANGFAVPDGFGVAPSTLRYRDEQAARTPSVAC
ncbi:MAG: DinB family protein [Verrucomicrobiota bacterium]